MKSKKLKLKNKNCAYCFPLTPLPRFSIINCVSALTRSLSQNGAIPIARIQTIRVTEASRSFQDASLKVKNSLFLIGPMPVEPVARNMFTTATTFQKVTMLKVSGFCHEPMNTVISAANPLKPGRPNEQSPAITNTVIINGIVFSKPPN